MIVSYSCKDIYKFYKEEGGTLTYNQFKAVIALDNKLKSDLIMGGYECPTILGVFRVAAFKRKFKLNEKGNLLGKIDYGASKKLKQEIIDRGGDPYQTYRDEQGIIVGNNAGEEWLVYHTSEFYYAWIWEPSYVTNFANYRFSPTRHNIRALKASETENSTLLYKEVDGANRDYILQPVDAKSRHYVRLEEQ